MQPAPEGGLIAYSNNSGRGEGTVKPTESHVSFFDVGTGTVGPLLDRGKGYRPPHGQGSWHPDAVHYALATGGQIRTWNARSGELTRQGTPSGPYVSGIDFSSDGSHLVIGELSGRVTLLDATTLTPEGQHVDLDEPVRQVSAGPDNHTAIALTGFQEQSGFWVGYSTGWAIVDLESGALVRRGHLEFSAATVAFSPDGRHVAIGGEGGAVMVLDTQTGEPLRSPVVGPEGTVTSLDYSPHGDRILASGADPGVGLWDGQTGLLVARVVSPQWPIAAEFRRDSDLILLAPLWEGPVYEWDPSIDSAIAFACRIADRDFTEAEWRENFGDRPYQETCPPDSSG